jgi:hypothetical protein
MKGALWMSIAAYNITSGPPFCSKMGRDRIAVSGGPSHDIQSYDLHALVDQRVLANEQ